MDNKKDIVIFTMERANELMSSGFRLVRIVPHMTIKGKLVFYFEDTQELREQLSEKYGINIK